VPTSITTGSAEEPGWVGISSDFNPDEIMRDLYAAGVAQMEDAVVASLVARAREENLPDADDIKLDITYDTDSGKMRIDEGRVRARANAILAGTDIR
jgi:hypothetical protein